MENCESTFATDWDSDSLAGFGGTGAGPSVLPGVVVTVGADAGHAG